MEIKHVSLEKYRFLREQVFWLTRCIDGYLLCWPENEDSVIEGLSRLLEKLSDDEKYCAAATVFSLALIIGEDVANGIFLDERPYCDSSWDIHLVQYRILREYIERHSLSKYAMAEDFTEYYQPFPPWLVQAVKLVAERAYAADENALENETHDDNQKQIEKEINVLFEKARAMKPVYVALREKYVSECPVCRELANLWDNPVDE